MAGIRRRGNGSRLPGRRPVGRQRRSRQWRHAGLRRWLLAWKLGKGTACPALGPAGARPKGREGVERELAPIPLQAAIQGLRVKPHRVDVHGPCSILESCSGRFIPRIGDVESCGALESHGNQCSVAEGEARANRGRRRLQGPFPALAGVPSGARRWVGSRQQCLRLAAFPFPSQSLVLARTANARAAKPGKGQEWRRRQ